MAHQVIQSCLVVEEDNLYNSDHQKWSYLFTMKLCYLAIGMCVFMAVLHHTEAGKKKNNGKTAGEFIVTLEQR